MLIAAATLVSSVSRSVLSSIAWTLAILGTLSLATALVALATIGDRAFAFEVPLIGPLVFVVLSPLLMARVLAPYYLLSALALLGWGLVLFPGLQRAYPARPIN